MREQMNIVVVGHVDHGKSTVIGRLLADTGSLPEGKLEQVKQTCERNARPFEYAFLLDALKDEQSQGITIDTARCFFKSATRDYIIIDAPGHVEFLKNMISGAARAEAALLVIDANEGIQENSKRHGYLLSMLGIKQIAVLVNKMDLVGYSKKVFESVCGEYDLFLSKLGLRPAAYIPISARDGENLTNAAAAMKWYSGNTVLGHIDNFTRQDDISHKPFRFPVQDVYKFTEALDDRRIIAGTVETGTISVNDKVIFHPSGKRSEIVSIEGFNVPTQTSAGPGAATGFTIKDELYLQRGEVMCRIDDEQPAVYSRFRANVFWMGNSPMVKGIKYKLKIATARVSVRLVNIISSIDATDLSTSSGKQQIDRHDVAECIFETTRPIAFDNISNIQSMGRFVIVDNYDIAGGGIITNSESSDEALFSEQIKKREQEWDKGFVTINDRENMFKHKAKFIVLTGTKRSNDIAKHLERTLFSKNHISYYLSLANLEGGLDSDVVDEQDKRDERIRRLGELARILTDAGTIFITAITDANSYDLDILSRLTSPNEFLHVSLGREVESSNVNHLSLDEDSPAEQLTGAILQSLAMQEIIPEYSI